MRDNVTSTSNKRIRMGAIFSYASIILEILINFLLLKYLTKQLGSGYGIYTIALGILGIFLSDFGLSQVVTRYVSKYAVLNETNKEKIFVSLIYKIYLVIDAVLVIAAILYFFLIPTIYGGLNFEELDELRKVFVLVSVYSLMALPMLPFDGILNGHERFSFLKILSIIQKIISSALLIGALVFELGVFACVMANVVSALICSVVKLFYLKRYKMINVDLRIKDKALLKTVLVFSIWIAISSLSTRLSLSIMSTVLASVCDSDVVAVFGICLTVETYAFTFSSAISGLFLPKITFMNENDNIDKINDVSISIGKFQSFISLLFLACFVSFGKEFLSLYLDSMYGSAYIPTILLLLTVFMDSPLLIPQTHSMAKGTIKYISIIEISIALVRLLGCWVSAKYYGLVGLCISYVTFSLISNIIKMVCVYWKKQGIKIGKFSFNVYLKPLLLLLVSIALGYVIKRAIPVYGWIRFLADCLILVILFSSLAIVFYLNSAERKNVFDKIVTKMPFLSKISDAFKNQNKENNVPVFLAYILVFISFLCSNYPIDTVSTIALFIFFLVSLLIWVIYLIPFFCSRKDFFRYLITNVGLLSVVVFIFGAIATFFYTRSFDSIFGFAKLLLYLVSAFLFTQCFSFKRFVQCFRKIMTFLCCSSLVITLLIIINGVDFSPIIYSNSYFNYLFIYFSLANKSSFANCGIFWEPGIYASFCIIAIVLELLFVKDSTKSKIVHLCIYGITLLSTKSLAGIILLAFICPILTAKIKNQKMSKYLTWGLIVSYIFAFILFVPMYGIIVKIFPFFANKGVSLTTRVLSFQVDFDIFKTSPIFGVGNKYSTLFSSFVENEYYGQLDASVSTSGFYLAYFGIIGGLFSILIYSLLFLVPSLSYSDKAVVTFLIFLISNKEPHSQSLLFLILVFYIFKKAELFKHKPTDTPSYSIYSKLKGKNVNEVSNK